MLDRLASERSLPRVLRTDNAGGREGSDGAEQETRVKITQWKLDRLDDAFQFAQSIDATSYERQRDRLRERNMKVAQRAYLVVQQNAFRVESFDLYDPEYIFLKVSYSFKFTIWARHPRAS